MAKRFWLFKSEPSAFSVDDLVRSPKRRAFWDGVRNYQARNLLRDEIQVGDRVLFYHSSTEVPAVVGVAAVVEAGAPDPTQFAPQAGHYDPKSSREAPRWYGVTIELVDKLPHPVTLATIKADPKLEGMELTRRGSRLSVQPVTKAHFERILALGR